jgi:hypothetical protein
MPRRKRRPSDSLGEIIMGTYTRLYADLPADFMRDYNDDDSDDYEDYWLKWPWITRSKSIKFFKIFRNFLVRFSTNLRYYYDE